MKLPEDVRQLLTRRFQRLYLQWAQSDEQPEPMVINLDMPTEQQASRQSEGVRAWISAWQDLQCPGTVTWEERRWRTWGLQRLPCRLTLADPQAIAGWIGEGARWQRARSRWLQLTTHWPLAGQSLSRYFGVLIEYDDVEFQRLVQLMTWLIANPDSGLSPREVPVSSVDTKWLDSRRGLVGTLVALIKGIDPSAGFYAVTGLKAPPVCLRLRLLDPLLRARCCGLEDITAPLEQLAAMVLPIKQAIIVENLQTGLAFGDLPGTVVIMRLGYAVDVLGRLPWLQGVPCFYWGDLDTHGFAILDRVRRYLPQVQSLLMDRTTLLADPSLWGKEESVSASDDLPFLTLEEQAVYRTLKANELAQQLRLEQERIAWSRAWAEIVRVAGTASSHLPLD